MNSLSEEGSFHINQLNQLQVQFWLLQYSFSIFLILSPERVSYIIQLSLDHLDPALVDYLNPYLSACPIRHPLWLYVSCGSQDSTVQGSSSHKCGQKSSCIAFNVVVAIFPQIFLSSYHPCAFMMHVPVIGASWKVTLIAEIHI